MITNWLDSATVRRLHGALGLEAARKWWSGMSGEQRGAKIGYGLSVVVCAAAVTVGLPQIAKRAEAQREDASLRGEAHNLSVAVRVAREAGLDVAQAAGWRSSEKGWRARVEEAVAQGPNAATQLVRQRQRDVHAIGAIETFTPAQYDLAEHEIGERRCLAEAIYYESRGEAARGQLAVAEVVMNRVRDPRYPKSICAVVYQGSHLKTGCQFTFTCDGSLHRKPRGPEWREANLVAMHTLLRLSAPMTGDATHYHTVQVDPLWRAGLVRTDRIGAHIFYRFPRAGEWAGARARLAEERAARGFAREAAAEATAFNPGEAVSGADPANFGTVGSFAPSSHAEAGAGAIAAYGPGSPT